MNTDYKVLIVEDDPMTLTLLSQMVKAIGNFEIQSCHSAVEAADQISRWTPDIILSDFMMDNGDGIDLLNKVRDYYELDIPFIFITCAKKEIISSKVTLLFETVAGQGTEIGRDFTDLGKIFPLLDKELNGHVGVCVDTCHIFAAGYDIRTPEKAAAVVAQMDKAFGIDKVKFMHLNDALKEFDSHVDRHQHIGQGFIGAAGFKAFLNHPKIKAIPKILETPVDEERGYEENLAAIRKLQT